MADCVYFLLYLALGKLILMLLTNYTYKKNNSSNKIFYNIISDNSIFNYYILLENLFFM